MLIFVTFVTNIKFFYYTAGNEYFFPPNILIGSKCDDRYSICDKGRATLALRPIRV